MKRARARTFRSSRHLKTAKNVVKGMSPVSAMVEAGYSESYARSHGYAVVKRLYIHAGTRSDTVTFQRPRFW
jgi:hypothetical protein